MKELTQEQQDDVVSRYERGQTMNFIAYATGIGRDRISAVLKSRGVKLRRAGGRGKARRSWGWTGMAAALLALSVVACGTPRDPSPVPQVSGLDELEARVTALEERRNLAAWCEPGCPAGVAEVRVKRDGIACKCVRPNVGVLRPLPGPGRDRS